MNTNQNAAVVPFTKHLTNADEIAAAIEFIEQADFQPGDKSMDLELHCSQALDASFSVAFDGIQAALESCLKAAGVDAEAEVVLPVFADSQLAVAVKRLGAKIVFADIEEDSLCMSPDSLSLAINSRTRAVIAADFGGNPHDAKAIQACCAEHGIAHLEFAGMGLGSRFVDGSSVGSDASADMTIFALESAADSPLGEVGLVMTGNESFANSLRELREGENGQETATSRPSPLNDFRAAVADVQLGNFSLAMESRRRAGKELNKLLHNAAKHGHFHLPNHTAGSAWTNYCLELDASCPLDQHEVLEELNRCGVEARKAFDLLHHDPVLSAHETGSFPIAEKRAPNLICLPMFVGMSQKEVVAIADAFLQILDGVLVTH